MGSKALSEQLLVTEDTAEQLMSDFQSTFTGSTRWWFSKEMLIRLDSSLIILMIKAVGR